MTELEIEQAILNYFTEVYDVKYVGTIKIKKMKPKGISVRLGIPNDYKPMFISADLEDQQFLNFFKKELRNRHMELVDFFKGIKTYPDDCIQNLDTRCGCHATN